MGASCPRKFLNLLELPSLHKSGKKTSHILSVDLKALNEVI